jgi:hypothetical protein
MLHNGLVLQIDGHLSRKGASDVYKSSAAVLAHRTLILVCWPGLSVVISTHCA